MFIHMSPKFIIYLETDRTPGQVRNALRQLNEAWRRAARDILSDPGHTVNAKWQAKLRLETDSQELKDLLEPWLGWEDEKDLEGP